MKKIFISIPWFSPAFKAGGPVQSIANMVNELKHGYEFYIFCGNTDLNEQPLHIIGTDRWVNYNAYTKVWYADKAKRRRNLVEQVKETGPDRLFIIGLFDWHFNIVPLFFCNHCPKVLSVRGMLHPGALSQKPVKKKGFLRLMRWLDLPRRTAFHATDKVEAEYIIDQFGATCSIFEAGNFPRLLKPGKAKHKKEEGKLKMVSIGIVSPMKNILLVLKALQHCRTRVQYDIYGPVKDARYWESCLQQIKLLPSNVKVYYHKEIRPDDVNEKLDDAELFIMPSKSENFGHAIYEALSAGLPVITSDYTPWNQLEESSAGFNVPLRADEIASVIDRVAAFDETTMEVWRLGAGKYAEAAIDTGILKQHYQQMFAI